jgi:glycosyltransferase involved in cell wall biosynthesis
MPKLQKKFLCFFTNAYPFGKGEAFIENELNFISPHFQKVYLFHKTKSQDVRDIPSNVELVYIPPLLTSVKARLLFENFFLVISFFFKEFFFSRQKKLFRKNIRYNVTHILNCIYYSNEIELKLSDNVLKNAFFYTYWFFDWNLSLSILRYRNIICKNYTRAHRFDLYEDDDKENYLPQRKFCLMYTDKVFLISKNGISYLKSLYPRYLKKMVLSYLGTKDFGINPTLNKKDFLHLVSCSNVNNVKRVHLIVEILSHINVTIKWTHIGDGLLMDDIKNKIKNLPKNVIVDFKGRLSQMEIFHFYKSVPIDVFINTSISEGLPVSIMEAISFGIPVFATNAGGTEEIVNEKTGVLISKDFYPAIVAKFIIDFCSSEQYPLVRKSARKYWEDNFSCQRNYDYFLQNNF